MLRGWVASDDRLATIVSVEFGVLGPLLVRDDDGDRTVRADRLRVLLAALLVRSGKAVSVDELANLVWSGNPPPRARTTLQSYVMRLRRVLGKAIGARVQTRPAGYQIDVADAESDLKRFEDLFASGVVAIRAADWERAAAGLGEALALWRGEALADIPSDLLLQTEGRRLNEMRVQALEWRITADLACGRHDQLVAELQRLVTEFPFRERLWENLLLALYRSGQQRAALEAFQQVRRQMVQELGVEPGEGLRQIHQQILAADPALALPAPQRAAGQEARPATTVARQVPGRPSKTVLPPDIADFTGREEQVEALEGFLGQVSGAAVAVAAVAGQAGTGKTTLAVHVAHRLRSVYQDGQLYASLHGARAHPAYPADVLAQFLRALGVDGRHIPDGLVQRTDMYRALLADRRVLVVLDDAADEAQVAALLPGCAGCGVLVTSRARLTGVPGAWHIDLGVFTSGEATKLLAAVAGDDCVVAELDAAAELTRLCDELPLAVRIVGAKLAARPHWSVAQLSARLADERKRLDELAFGTMDVRASLALSYVGLCSRARRLLRRLSLLDAADFASWVGAALLDAAQADAEDLMENLAAARLLEVNGRDGTGQIRYRFHDLVRVYARERAAAEETPDERTDALGRAFGAWLGLTVQARRKTWGEYLMLKGTAPAFPLDPALSTELMADPVDWYESERACIVTVVRQAGQMGLDELCWELATAATAMFEARSHYDEWRQTHEQALTVTRRAGNRRGEAAVQAGLASLAITQHRYDEAGAALQTALRYFSISDRVGHIFVLRSLGYLERIHGRHRRALRYYGQARALADGTADRLVQAAVLRSIGSLYLELGQPKLARSYLEHSVEISGAGRAHTQALYRLGEIYLVEGELDRAEQVLTQAQESLREGISNVRGEAYALYGLGVVALRRSQPDRAADLLEQALAIARQVGERLIENRVLLALAELYGYDNDRAAELRARAQNIRQELGILSWSGNTLHSPEGSASTSIDPSGCELIFNDTLSASGTPAIRH